MLKTAIIAGALVWGVPAVAEPLPIQGLYCGDGLDVSAEGVGGEDFFCTATEPVSMGKPFRMTCKGVDTEEPAETITATLTDNGDKTLTYSDDDGSAKLEPCPE